MNFTSAGRVVAALAAAGLAVVLTAPAQANELSKEEKAYVMVALTSVAVAHQCGYTIVPGSLLKLGDRLGVADAVGLAVTEKMRMDYGEQYDRTLLIPEVTRFADEAVDALIEATKRKDKFCRDFGGKMLDQGTVRK